ncbi:hypothetical protein SeMB42_g04581 [Synchytrium endobioticum]|nr:hypothetical protein SeMB42_g04581 [Synchytrium endobioticum]
MAEEEEGEIVDDVENTDILSAATDKTRAGIGMDIDSVKYSRAVSKEGTPCSEIESIRDVLADDVFPYGAVSDVSDGREKSSKSRHRSRLHHESTGSKRHRSRDRDDHRSTKHSSSRSSKSHHTSRHRDDGRSTRKDDARDPDGRKDESRYRERSPGNRSKDRYNRDRRNSPERRRSPSYEAKDRRRDLPSRNLNGRDTYGSSSSYNEPTSSRYISNADKPFGSYREPPPPRPRSPDYAKAIDKKDPVEPSHVTSSTIKMNATGEAKDGTIIADSTAVIEPEVEVIDEDRLIEERRKRRQALLEQFSKERAAAPGIPKSLTSAEEVKVEKSELLTMKSDSTTTKLKTVAAVDIRLDKVAADVTRVSSEEGPTGVSTPAEDVEETSQPDMSFSLEKHNEGTAVTHQSDCEDIDAAEYNPDQDKIEDEYKLHHMHHSTTVGASNSKRKQDANGMFSTDISEAEVAEAKRRKTLVIADEDDMFALAPVDDMFPPLGTTTASTATEEKASHILESAPVVRSSDNPALLDNWDDPEGYYRIILGEVLDGRYHVYANLGRGVFSSVVKAKDGEMDVAIKIIRNNETMFKAGMRELTILRKLNEADPDDKKHVVRLIRHFEHRKHLCLVFESLSMNLREVLKKFGKHRGLNIHAVRIYAQQLFQALHLLKKCRILHADIKPDNILVSNNKSHLKLCDLGSASESSENEITPYLVSRFYRAPEIILGMPYEFALDVWSVGCTLYELYTGKILFPGRTNNQMLKLIMEVRGRINKQMLRRGQLSSLHFEDSGNFMQVEIDKLSGKDVTKSVAVPLQPSRDIKAFFSAEAASVPKDEAAVVIQFADLLDKALQLNPERRLTPRDALLHPFINPPKS